MKKFILCVATGYVLVFILFIALPQMMEKMQQQQGGQPQGMGDANGAMGRAGDQLGQGKPKLGQVCAAG